MTEDRVMKRLQNAVADAGGQRAFAREKGFSASYVNDVLLGRRGFSEAMCAALGVKREVSYSVNYTAEQPEAGRR